MILTQEEQEALERLRLWIDDVTSCRDIVSQHDLLDAARIALREHTGDNAGKAITNDERQAAQRIIDAPDVSFDGVTVQSVESVDAKLVAAALLREMREAVTA